MARKSVKNRNQNRFELVTKERAKRNALRTASVDVNSTEEERIKARKKLQALPRNSCPVRRRNRCKLCGRPRGYNRLTGLCRLHMRSTTIDGMVPGMHKASW